MKEFLANNYLLSVIIVPVVIAMFKNELSLFFTAWSAYRNRKFDDGDPETTDKCQILNVDGKWVEVEVKNYQFSFAKSRRGVDVYYLLEDGRKSYRRFSLLEWAKVQKRSMPRIY